MQIRKSIPLMFPRHLLAMGGVMPKTTAPSVFGTEATAARPPWTVDLCNLSQIPAVTSARAKTQTQWKITSTVKPAIGANLWLKPTSDVTNDVITANPQTDVNASRVIFFLWGFVCCI